MDKGHYLDIDNWIRKEHFLFFKEFEEPFHGVSVDVDCTEAYHHSKKLKTSFFLYYLHATLKAVNEIENFRMRITADDRVYVYDQIHVSATIARVENTFGMSFIDHSEDYATFVKNAEIEIKRVKETTQLLPEKNSDAAIHCSTLPWLKFTSLSHARQFSRLDSCPKITYGKTYWQNERLIMPVSVHVHHALVDGYHVGVFFEKLEHLLRHPKTF